MREFNEPKRRVPLNKEKKKKKRESQVGKKKKANRESVNGEKKKNYEAKEDASHFKKQKREPLCFLLSFSYAIQITNKKI